MLMKKEKQLLFKELEYKTLKTTHGGELSRGKRKTRRPLSLKKPIHVVLRSSRARGVWSLRSFKNKSKVDNLILRLAVRFKIRIYRFANVGNHIHIVMRTKERVYFQNYIRSLAGLIVCTVTGARKGLKIGRF